MKRISTLLGGGFLAFSLLAASLRAPAATVYVGLWDLRPSTVYVKVGEPVSWVDEDDFGPYLILFPTIYGYTPCYTSFSTPGAYSYTVESGWGGGDWYGTVVVSPAVDSPPVVAITNPTNNASFIAPASFSFDADASDPDPNDVMDVQFFIDGAMVGDVYSPPYSTPVASLGIGPHTLTAIVWDYSYESGTNSVMITVNNPPPVTLDGATRSGNQLVFQINGMISGNTYVLQCSTNMTDWAPMLTNASDGTSLGITNSPTGCRQFFRVMQQQ